MKWFGSALLVGILMISSMAEAEDVGQFVLLSKEKVAVLTGPVTDRTATDFDRVLAQMPDIETVVLDSPGGQVIGALAIARKISEMKLDTIVLSGMTCASACSIILLAGDGRTVEGRLGVHQMSSRQPANLGAVQLLLAQILDAFASFGVDARVTQFMLTTPSEDMHFFEDYELAEYSINRNSRLSVAVASPGQSQSQAVASVSSRRDGARFADHPISTIFAGPTAKPQYVGDAEGARNYRTRIKNGLAAGPNFAGSWSLVEIGCGTSCRFVIPIDGRTGKIVKFPLAGGEDNYQMELTYIVESSLVKSVWKDTTNGRDDTCVQQDFAFEDGKFTLVWENRYTIEQYGFCTAFQ